MNTASNIWWTKKSRIETEKRLLANAFQSQVLLIWYSFASAAASIFYLNPLGGWPIPANAGVVWVIFSILTLVISVFLSGLSFKERAGLVKDCYDSLKDLESRLKSGESEVSVAKDYAQILRVCENHSDKDYYMALVLAYYSQPGRQNDETGLKPGLDNAPSCSQIALLIFWCLRRWIMLLVLYSLPIVIFYFTGIGS